MRGTNVLLPLAGAGIVLLLATGGLSTFKTWLQGWITNGASDPFSTSTAPFTPVNVGIGGDLATIAPSSSQSVGTHVAGTFLNPNSNLFTLSGYFQFPNPNNPGQTLSGFSSELKGQSFQATRANGTPYPAGTSSPTGTAFLQPLTGLGGNIITTVNGLINSLTPAQIQSLATYEGQGNGATGQGGNQNFVLQLPPSATVPIK